MGPNYVLQLFTIAMFISVELGLVMWFIIETSRKTGAYLKIKLKKHQEFITNVHG